MRNAKPLACLIMLSLFVVPVASALAQTQKVAPVIRRGDPSVRLTAEQASNFSMTLQTLAQQGGAAFVVEGRPFAPERKAEQASSSTETIPLGQAVQEAADAFDYQVSRKDKLFVLTKRYTDVADLPAVTAEEAKAATKDVYTLIRLFSPTLATGSTTRDAGIKKFLFSLTPEQWQLMSDKKLAVRSLTPPQKEQVWRVALHFYVELQTEKAVLNCIRPLERATNPEAFAGWTDNNHKKVKLFGFGTMGGEPKRPMLQPLDNSLFSNNYNVAFQREEELKKGIDFGEATAEEKASIAARSKFNNENVKTLGSVVDALNARSDARLVFQSDAMFAEKPVLIFGEQFISSQTLFSACAEVYGLRVAVEQKGSVLRLTRPYVRKPRTVFELPDAIRGALPAPYLRAMHIADQDTMRGEVQQDAQTKAEQISRGIREPVTAEQIAQEKQAQERRERMIRYVASPTSLRLAGIKRFRATVEPKAKAAPNQQVLLSALDAEEQAALTTVIMHPLLDTIRFLMNRNPPSYIRRFDELVLGGGKYISEEGEPRFGMDLGFPQSDGGLDVRVGFANARLPEPDSKSSRP